MLSTVTYVYKLLLQFKLLESQISLVKLIETERKELFSCRFKVIPDIGRRRRRRNLIIITIFMIIIMNVEVVA